MLPSTKCFNQLTKRSNKEKYFKLKLLINFSVRLTSKVRFIWVKESRCKKKGIWMSKIFHRKKSNFIFFQNNSFSKIAQKSSFLFSVSVFVVFNKNSFWVVTLVNVNSVTEIELITPWLYYLNICSSPCVSLFLLNYMFIETKSSFKSNFLMN